MASIRETRLQDTLVAQLQNTEAFRAIPPEAKTIINQSIEDSAAALSGEYVNTIDQQSNQALNFIPKNLVGVNNPVDVVNGNLLANDLKGTLNNSIGTQLNSSLSNKLTDTVFNSFINKLPPVLKSTIDLNSLKGALSGSSQSAMTQGLDQTFNSFASQTLSGTIPLQPVVQDVSSYFTREGAAGLTTVNLQYDNAIASDAIRQAQQFNVENTDNIEKLITKTQGFIDPTATFPTKEYAGRSETNKLAQGEINGTIVQTKEKERLRGAQLPDNESWEQPTSPFNGQYPYNKVIQTESGHIIEMDDTPGCERLHVYHKSGTFIEIDSNGSVVRKTKGSSYEIIDRNGYISVTGDANLSVKGAIKIYVGGDANIEVEGDTNIKCFNDITMQAAGRVDISATEEINLHSANVNIEADINLNLKGDISAYLSTKDLFMKANATIYQEALGGFNIKSKDNINIDSDGDVFVQSDKAESSSYALNANIGLIGARKDIITETITDPISPNFLDKFGYVAEDSEFEEEATAQQNQLREFGITTQGEIDENQISIESDSPTSTASTIVRPSDFILSQTFLPDNFQLSKHFTLAQVSSRAVVSNYPVVAQLGLSYGQIVYNLQGMALNILEPVLALYPNMFVTSGFRTATNSSTTSDHPRGKAVDIQFKNVSKGEYFDIAKKLATNLVYDKILLEYKTYGTGLPWIHISLDIDKPRKIVLTYLNDKKYGDGLTNLA